MPIFAVSLYMIRMFGPHLRPLFRFAFPPGPRRTKTSKVQNSVVTLHHRASTEEVLPVYVELAPMARKCAATIATSHHRTITDIMRDTACAPSVEHSASSSSGGLGRWSSEEAPACLGGGWHLQQRSSSQNLVGVDAARVPELQVDQFCLLDTFIQSGRSNCLVWTVSEGRE